MGCNCVKGANSGKTKRPNKVSKRQSRSSSRKEAHSGGYYSSSNKGIEAETADRHNGRDEATACLIPSRDSDESAYFNPIDPSEEADEKFTSPSLEEVVDESDRSQLVGKGKPGYGLRGEQPQICTALNVRNRIDGAQVVAGWPTWLSSVAGNAIKGWIPRKLESFEKLDKIGHGTYSIVYRARDLETGKLVALKKVHFQNMNPDSVRFMAREILILRMLDHPNVMKLEGLITSRFSHDLYLVFEYMEHDLAGLAALHEFTEPQIKCYAQQLFRGLEHCHSHGVLHRDIKCSNLLIDNRGNLKIGDFGLATKFNPYDQKQLLTTCLVTLWYRPPELLLGATDYGTAVDLWSSGCILAELFAGNPIMPGRTEIEQLHKIYKLCGSPSEEYWKKVKAHAAIYKPPSSYRRSLAEAFHDFPPSALTLLDSLLAFEPELRGSATSALQSEFFSTRPLPCNPSSLPKYTPSKESNAGVRNEATKRRRTACGRTIGLESLKSDVLEPGAVPEPDSDAEFKAFMKKWTWQSMCNLDDHNPEDEDGDSCYTIEFPKGYMQNGQFRQPGNPKDDADEGSSINSPTPSADPSEYIEFRFERSDHPEANAFGLPAFPYNVTMHSGSPELDHISKAGVEARVQEQYSKTLFEIPDPPYKDSKQVWCLEETATVYVPPNMKPMH